MAAPASAAPGQNVVVNCAGKGVVKPKQITVTCADADVVVSGITWSSWNLNSAKGTGTLIWNTCLPETCVAGITQKYKVKVTLGGVASGPSVTAFSQMKLTFPDGSGPAAANSSSYTLDNELQ